jgi:amino acid transporter
MSPSLALYFNWGPLTTSTGPIAPLIFLIALLVSIPSAVSYAMVSKELPSAGQAYTWLWRSMSPSVGVFIGIILLFYYMASAGWDVPMYFALFFKDLMVYLGQPDTWVWPVVGVVLLMAGTALVVFREIKFNTKVVIGLLVFETLAVTALAVTILVVKGGAGELNLDPFSFSAATNGADGIFNGLIFAILSFIGYDYACVVAEEAKTPKRLMPIAVILAAVTIGLFWIFVSYALSESIDLSTLPSLIASGSTPIMPISHQYWGRGDILIIVTGLTASAGIYVAAIPVLARVLFAMARDGVFPRSLARLNPKTRTPNTATVVVMVAATGGTLGMAALQRSFYGAFVWFAEAAVFFALLTYIAVNIGNFTFYRRFRRDKFSIWLNLIIPLVGVLIDGYLIWRAFFVALWPTGWALGSSVVVFAVAVCLLGMLYVAVLRKRSPELFRRKSFVLEDEADVLEDPLQASTPDPLPGR